MCDFNMVNVEPNNNTGRILDKITEDSLKLQWEQYQEFFPGLKQLQVQSNKLVKQFHEYFSQKQRKIGSLPYKMMKKFQRIKLKLLQLQKILNNQSLFFKINIDNRENEKNHDQLFFRKMLKSYDQRRLYMKQYILKNENKMQEVQQIVKKNIDYETHQYTQFLNLLSIERLQHNYQMKLQMMQKVKLSIKKNIQLRQAIKEKIKKKKIIIQEKYVKNGIQSKNQTNKQPKLSKQMLSKQKFIKQQKNKAYSPLPQKINQNLLYLFITKQQIRNNFLFFELKKLKMQNKNKQILNNQLKSSIDKIKQYLYNKQIQNNIIFSQWSTKYNNQFFTFIEQKEKQSFCSNKITKTDYFIYLKQLYRSTIQFTKIYGSYFIYLFVKNNNKNNNNNNFKSSKSAMKYYPCKYQKQIKQKEYLIKLKEIQKYKKDNIDQILNKRQKRQIQQQQILKKIKNSQQQQQKNKLKCNKQKQQMQNLQQQKNIILDQLSNQQKYQYANDNQLSQVSFTLNRVNSSINIQEHHVQLKVNDSDEKNKEILSNKDLYFEQQQSNQMKE